MMCLLPMIKYVYINDTRQDIRSNAEWPLEDVLVIHPGTVVHHEQQLHKATVSLQIRAYPFVVAVLISQQDHNHMWHCSGPYHTLDMLQPPCWVRHLLLFTAVKNQNQAVHVLRDVTLNHSRTCVETLCAVKTKKKKKREKKGKKRSV